MSKKFAELVKEVSLEFDSPITEYQLLKKDLLKMAMRGSSSYNYSIPDWWVSPIDSLLKLLKDDGFLVDCSDNIIRISW